MVDKIVLDLQNFDQNAPMGAIAYDGDEVIRSEYCSDADDFMYSGEILVEMVTEIIRNFN